MIFIKSIEIENFQSHKYSKLDFSENLNVIVGPSDNGKSAIIRALKWVLFNEPKGTEFIRYGENFCRVSIILSDGSKIIRERTKTKNLYKLIKNSNETVFEGFGNDIPVDIIEAHQINKVNIDKENNICLNISEQLEGPFLLNQPNSLKSKAIGKIIGLHILDDAVKGLSRDIVNIQNTKKLIQNNLEGIDEKINNLSYINDLKLNIEKKEEIINKLNSKVTLLNKLIALNNKLKTIKSEQLDLEYNITILSKVDKVNLDILFKKLTFYLELKKIYKSLTILNQDMKKQEEIINITSSINNLEKILLLLNNKVESLNKIVFLHEKYTNTNILLYESELIINKTKDIKTVEQIFVRLEESLKQKQLITEKYNQYSANRDSINKGLEYMKKFNTIDSCNETIVQLENKNNIIDKLRSLNNNLKNINTEINDNVAISRKYSNEIQQSLVKYKEILNHYSICPTCGSEINNDKINSIIKTIWEE